MDAPTPESTLRRAVPADADAVTECAKAAYEPYVAALGARPGPLLDDYAELIRRHRVWVLETEQTLVGFVILIEKKEHALLDNVAVYPEHHGKGWGRRLIALAETEARRSGYGEIQLYTHEGMQQNRDLYKRLGYEEFAERFERGLPRVYMRKPLV